MFRSPFQFQTGAIKSQYPPAHELDHSCFNSRLDALPPSMMECGCRPRIGSALLSGNNYLIVLIVVSGQVSAPGDGTARAVDMQRDRGYIRVSHSRPNLPADLHRRAPSVKQRRSALRHRPFYGNDGNRTRHRVELPLLAGLLLTLSSILKNRILPPTPLLILLHMNMEINPAQHIPKPSRRRLINSIRPRRYQRK